MASFLDDENEMYQGAILQEIADQLLEDWMNANSDEGDFWLDFQIAVMSNDLELKQKFNKFYNLKEDDEHYVN